MFPGIYVCPICGTHGWCEHPQQDEPDSVQVEQKAPDRVDKVAEALWQSDEETAAQERWQRSASYSFLPWSAVDTHTREYYLRRARAALAVVDGEGSASRAAFELRQAFDRLDAETVNEQQEARAAQVAWRHVQRAYDELRAASPGSSGGEQLTALELMAADYLESEGKVGVDVSPTVETYLARARRLAGGVEAEPEESGEPRWRCPRHGLVVSSEVAYESHSQIPYHAKGSCGTDLWPVAEPEVE